MCVNVYEIVKSVKQLSDYTVLLKILPVEESKDQEPHVCGRGSISSLVLRSMTECKVKVVYMTPNRVPGFKEGTTLP